MIGEIIFFISAAWALCILISTVIITYDENVKADNRVIFLFPANLIFIIKYWWKTIVKAIKS